jgi:ferredoxin
MPGIPEHEERVAHGLRIRIDRTLCVGFGDCITLAPQAFELDADGVAVFLQPESITREALIAACDECPVDAITVWDEAEGQVVPS